MDRLVVVDVYFEVYYSNCGTLYVLSILEELLASKQLVLAL